MTGALPNMRQTIQPDDSGRRDSALGHPKLTPSASRVIESLLEMQARKGPKFVAISIAVAAAGHIDESSKRLCVPLPAPARSD